MRLCLINNNYVAYFTIIRLVIIATVRSLPRAIHSRDLGCRPRTNGNAINSASNLRRRRVASADQKNVRRKLQEVGKAARYVVSPTANMRKPPLPDFVLQLEEARAEWRRRHRESGPGGEAG
jgi:hypothetical protein